MKKLVSIVLVLSFLSWPSFAAFINTMAFEVDAATGNDANGGGFDDTSGTPGTNFAWGGSQAVTSYTDLVIGAADNTTLTSVAHPFGATHVGNVINITSGTGFTTGRYQVISVAGVIATLDRAVGTTSSTGGNGKLGGSLLTIQKGIDSMFINAGAVESGTVWIKKGNYTGTVALTTAGSVGPSHFHFRIVGYSSSHGDNPTPQSGNQPVYAVGSGAGVDGLDDSGANGYWIGYITFDGTATSGSQGLRGITSTSAYITIFGCKVKNFSSDGIKTSGLEPLTTFCESTGNGGIGIYHTGAGSVSYNWVHKNTGAGIEMDTQPVNAHGNLVTNNTGQGIYFNDPFGGSATGNTIYGNGSDGMKLGTASYDLVLGTLYINNIIAKNGGWGIATAGFIPTNQTTSGNLDYNAFYSNTSGNIQNGAALNTHDVSVSINPFNSSDVNLAAETSPDWGLNNTANAGASLRAVGFPGTFYGLATTTGYRDIGIIQHQDSGGGGTSACAGSVAVQGGQVLIQ